MNVEDIEIHAGGLNRPYRTVGPITARSGAGTALSKAPTMEDVNFKLREVALKMGANAVINVEYKRGVSAMSWKAMTATGTAVILVSDERTCPLCAETVKKAAIRCKHCGADLEPEPVAPAVSPMVSTRSTTRTGVCRHCKQTVEFERDLIEAAGANRKRLGCPKCGRESPLGEWKWT